MADNVNPLGEQHLIDINNALANAVIAQKQLDLAKRAGFDVSVQQKTLDDSVAKLRQVKQVYFPGQ